jgi:hypothetical protein
MGMISSPGPVKLFTGMIAGETALFEELISVLEGMFGAADLTGPVWPWTYSTYYREEMGPELKRQFVFFGRLIQPDEIAGVKRTTNALEEKYRNANGSRRINLDPGYLDAAKLVLVSTKDFSHRIYLARGIYGEVTLIYSHNDYQPLHYTYPDYRSDDHRGLFRKARRLYMETLRTQP